MQLYAKVVCIALLFSSSLNFSLDIFDHIQYGNKQVIKLCLQSCQDVNVVNDQGQTPLM